MITRIIKKIDNVNFEHGLKILQLYVIQKNYKCDSPNYPLIHVFTLTSQETI
jgi:hypothetical protein